MDGIVILGAGQAGIQLASTLREMSYGGPIHMVGDEPVAPYQRPPLSKAFLSGATPEAALFMQEPDFFAKHDIRFMPSTEAQSVDRELKQVNLKSGDRLPYDHLVFATGARNRALPCAPDARPGVISLRTLEDSKMLAKGLEAAANIVIIGAGFLGLEAATVAAAAGRDVRVIEAGPRPLGRAVTEPVSEVVRRCHHEQGVRFDFDETVVALHGKGAHDHALETRSGERIKADLVLVSVGVTPNTELAAAAGLPVDNGIVVNEVLLTEDPAISAIGDCAAFPFAADGGRMVRVESVQNAVDQARCVAERLVGKPAAYDQVPTFWSDQAGLRLQMAGLAMAGDRAVVRGDPTSKAFSVFCYRGDRLVAVESVSRPPDYMLGRRLLRAGISPTPGQAADSSVDLKAFLAASKTVA